VLFAAAPDPSSPGFPAFVSILFGFAGTTCALYLGLSRETVQWIGFLSAYFGIGAGLIIYLVSIARAL